MMPWIWLAIIIITVIYEVVTYEMESVWFTIGAIVALILSFFVKQWWIQALVFAVVSVVMFASLRKWSKKLMSADFKPTNFDALIGREITVLKTIPEKGLGEGKVNSVVWSLESIDGKEIKENEIVIIKKIEGNRLIVQKEELK